jgi:hypothetical protein
MGKELKHDPNTLCERFYSQAKRWWGASLICKFIVILVGALAIYLSVFSTVVPFFVFTLTITSEWFVWRSDKDKGVAESLRRKLDFRDSFDWDISKADISDILARTSKSFRLSLPSEGQQGPYFASKDSHIPTRAIKNIQESAWWNKHLSERIGRYTFIVMLLTVISSIALLIASIGTVNNFDTLSSIGRVVTSVLMIVLSLGLIRLTFAYYEFQRKSQRMEERTIEYLKYGCTDVEAIRLYNDFHLDRALAPLIPDWIYNRNKAHLNEVWKDYRTD